MCVHHIMRVRGSNLIILKDCHIFFFTMEPLAAILGMVVSYLVFLYTASRQACFANSVGWYLQSQIFKNDYVSCLLNCWTLQSQMWMPVHNYRVTGKEWFLSASSRSQGLNPGIKMCSSHIFWTTEPFVIELGILVHHQWIRSFEKLGLLSSRSWPSTTPLHCLVSSC